MSRPLPNPTRLIGDIDRRQREMSLSTVPEFERSSAACSRRLLINSGCA